MNELEMYIVPKRSSAMNIQIKSLKWAGSVMWLNELDSIWLTA